jgi:glyoxalase family protein
MTMDNILGLHHITAIAGSARRNYEFYTNVLGLRLVKKTVNFDDPGTYHFYYGNEKGEPGTILTFFPWEGISQGRTGTGMATHIRYTVPAGSLEYWSKRLREHNVAQERVQEWFGEQQLFLRDPDDLSLQLVTPATPDNRVPWTKGGVPEENAIRGFHSTVLTVKKAAPTAEVLTNIFGYKLLKQEENRYRYVTDAITNANVIDIIEVPGMPAGNGAGGTIHHVAFRVKDEKVQMEFREKIERAGFNITPKIDRQYFYSLYFREHNGILFEIATDNPGFDIDEPVTELGSHLKLPAQYESARSKIEAVLPEIV